MGVDESRVRRHDDAGLGPGSADATDQVWWFRDAVLRMPQIRSERQILVVTAPPGSGRSRLVRRWLERPPGTPWTWASLRPGTGQPPGESAPGQVAAAAVRQHLDRHRGGFVVLDGVETLTPEELEHLLTQLPSGPRVVLLGCGEVLSPALAVRLAGRIAEIRADDLWWPAEVVAAQLKALTGRSVDAAPAEQIHRGSGGWPAGVLALGQAAAGAARWSAAEAVRPGVDRVPAELADLTADLVLAGLPTQLRDFVLVTAEVEECVRDPRLCAALLPQADPQTMLGQAVRWGLNVERWPYREIGADRGAPESSTARPFYHPFVAAAARRMRERQAGPVDEALARTGKIASDLGRAPLAVDCMLAAGAWDDALDELERAAPQGFRGWDGIRLRRALRDLPHPAWAPVARHRAVVALAAAVCGDHLLAAEATGQAPASVVAEPWWPALTRLTGALTMLPPSSAVSEPAVQVSLGQALVNQAPVNQVSLGQSPVNQVPLGQASVEQTPVEQTPVEQGFGLSVVEAPVPGPARLPDLFGLGDEVVLDTAIHVLAARGAAFAGVSAQVRRHLDAARPELIGRLPGYLMLAALGADALSRAWTGELTAAAGLAARADRLAAQGGLAGHPMLAAAVLAEAEVLRARGEPGRALEVLDRAAGILPLGDTLVVDLTGGPLPARICRVLRARLLLDQADRPGTREHHRARAGAELERLRADGGEQLPPGPALHLALARARLAELGGDQSATRAWLEAAAPVAAVAARRLFLALHRQDEEEAAAVLAAWPADAGPADRVRRLLAEAAVALTCGRRHQAAELVGEALRAGEPDGHVRVFLDVPTALRGLISSVVRGIPEQTDRTRALSVRLDEAGATGEDGAGVTRRELVVLEHLTSDRTHAQIAAELFVSENTLKSHCRNLYRKLGVHSREDAVRIARVQGWLRPASPRGDVVLDVNATGVSDVVEL